MTSLIKKIVACATVLTLGLSMVAPASAATVDELQAQIAALQAQLNQLLQQLGQVQGGTGQVPTACTGITFDRNLKQGMSGNDVKCLQAMLNTDSATQVASSGAGSPGNETIYFGPLTKAAVVKFQEKYASEVLTPLGLTSGTGYVGVKTIAKLNAMLTTPPPVACTTDADCGAGKVCQGGVCVTAPVTGADLTVALDSTNPAAGNIYVNPGVAGSANSVVARIRFTAGANAVTISGLSVTKYGTVADGVVDVARVKVYDGATQLGARVLVMNKATFIFAPTVSVAANSSKILDLMVDIAAGAGLTRTIALGVTVATDVTASVTASGTFPLVSNYMTIAGAAFGAVNAAAGANPPATIPRVGENDRILGNFVISSGANEDVLLTSMTFSDLGTTADGDITDIKAKAGSETLGTAGSLVNRRAVITMNKDLSRGSSVTVQVTGDITAGVGRALTLALIAPDAVVAKGKSTGVYFIAPPANVPMPATFAFAGGGITITPNVNSPTDDLVNAPIAQTIGIFDVRAIGEDVVVQTADVRVTNGAGGFTVPYNIALFDKNGALLSTIVAVPAAAGAQNPADLTLSWTVKANTTEQLYVKAYTNVLGALDAGQTMTVGLPLNGVTGIGVLSAAQVNFPAAAFALPAITYRDSGSLLFALDTTLAPVHQAALIPSAENYWAAFDVIATREDMTITSLQFNDVAAETTGAFVTCSLYDRALTGTLTNLDTQPWNFVGGAGNSNVVFNTINLGAGITVPKGAANAKVLVVKCSVVGTATAGNAPELNVTAAASVTATGAISGLAPQAVVLADLRNSTRGAHILVATANGVLYVKPNASAPSGNISRSSTATLGMWDLTAKGANVTILPAGAVLALRFTSYTGGISAGSVAFRLVDATTGTVYAPANAASTATTVTFNGASFAVPLAVLQDQTVTVRLQENITNAGLYPQFTMFQFGINTSGIGIANDAVLATALGVANNIIVNSGGALFVLGTNAAYLDGDASGTITVGDTRLAIGNTLATGLGFAPLSVVVCPGDADCAAGGFAGAAAGDNIDRTGGAGAYVAGDGLYIDADAGNTITGGDTRVVIGNAVGTGLGNAAGTIIPANNVVTTVGGGNVGGLPEYPASGLQAICPEVRIQ